MGSLPAGTSHYSQQMLQQQFGYGQIGGQLSGGSFGTLTITHGDEDDEDDRSENEQWLDSRVDEMRVKL